MRRYFVGYTTESVGTDIVVVCPARGTSIPVLSGLSVTTGGTEQTLYFLKPMAIVWTMSFTQNGTTTTAISNVFPLKDSTGDPVGLGEDDLLVVINEHSQFEMLKVASVTGNTVTWAAGPSEDVLYGSLVYIFLDPLIGQKELPPTDATFYERLIIPANTTLELRDIKIPASVTAPINGMQDMGAPMALYLTNDTDQASIEYAAFEYYDPTQEEFEAARDAFSALTTDIPFPPTPIQVGRPDPTPL